MSKTDEIYAEVTARIVAQLEAGCAPWSRPWRLAEQARNLSGRYYRGINRWLLAQSPYRSPYWGTFNAIKAEGGMVRKGERGTKIILWRPFDGEDEDGNPVKRFFITTYTIFNSEQTEGLTLPEIEETREVTENNSAEAIIAGMTNAPSIAYDGGNRAYYSPAEDGIHLPPRDAFQSDDEFYSTLFHELAHSTGHESRLSRHDGNHRFGSHNYGREELVAEMSSAMLCGTAGIEATIDNSAAYLQSWIKAIKEDTKAIVWAASRAEAAANYILGVEA